MNTINPQMIILAREGRHLTQQELGERVGLHKANISRLEHGDTAVSEETLQALCQGLQYPSSFFYQQGSVMPSLLSYRKREKVPAKLITPIEARINILLRHVQFITRATEKPLPAIPVYGVTRQNSPQQVAIMLRKQWGMGNGPVASLTKILEGQGIIICPVDFETERVDSRSMLTADKYPAIFINSLMMGDRQRFSLAFELGHLVMHTNISVPHHRDVKHEANLFAAELLMPASAVIKDFKKGVTLPLLGHLKRKWKVSMIALLYRADDLGLLTANQKRYLQQQFNQQKIRRREPPQLDIPFEKPQLMRQLLAAYGKKYNLGVEQMAALLCTEVNDYLEYYG